MNDEFYNEKKEDYKDLFDALSDMLERFSDYSPERQQELEAITKKACENCEDLPKGKDLFVIMKSYIMHRYNEMNEYRERRAKAEREFLNALPEIFDKLAVPNDDSVKDIADLAEKFANKNNLEILVEKMLRAIASI